MNKANFITDKKELRQLIYQEKRILGEARLHQLSEQIIARIESTPEFQHSTNLLAYYALPFEVDTRNAVESWSKEKSVWLPVVVGEHLVIKKFESMAQMKQGAFGVWEPCGETLEDLSILDLVLVPGVAFDLHGNRTGYGKGFYDRLLPQLQAKRMGICFEFQLFNQIPNNHFDQQVDLILTELQQVP